MPHSPNALRTQSFCPRASQRIRVPGNSFREPWAQSSTSQTLMSHEAPGLLLKCRFPLTRSGVGSGSLRFQQATKSCRYGITLGTAEAWSTALAGSALLYLPRQASVQLLIPKRTALMQISRGSGHRLPPQTWTYSTHCKFHHRPSGNPDPSREASIPGSPTQPFSLFPHAAHPCPCLRKPSF